MTRLIILVVLAVVAVGVAFVLQRRRPEPPSAPSYRAPVQLDRDDFAGPTELPLVVVFGSTTCSSCPEVWDEVERSKTDAFVIEQVNVQDDPKRHDRYKIDGVPTTLVVGADGVVVSSFFGPLRDGALQEAIEVVTN